MEWPKNRFEGKKRTFRRGPMSGGLKLDSNAFEELHHTYHDRLQASVLSCVRNREEAEDITAAAFEAAFANRESFRAEAAPATWLHAIALNKLRRSREQRKAVSLDLFTGELPSGLVTFLLTDVVRSCEAQPAEEEATV